MSSTKLPLAILLLLSGTVMFGWIQYSAEAKVCPLFCVQAEYMTCNSTAGERLNPVCNCCFAPEGGCTIYLSNGAIGTVVTVAEILKNNGLATEKKIQTSTVGTKDEAKGRLVRKAKIEILLGKTENFNHLVSTNKVVRQATEAEE
ncbi:unnamed protein product [Musa hybrid cultivar]